VRANHPWLAEKKRAGAAATGEKVRGMALKATGAELLAEVRAAALKTRRTANAAIRETDCMKDARKYSEANPCFCATFFLQVPTPHTESQRYRMCFQSGVNPLLLLASTKPLPNSLHNRSRAPRAQAIARECLPECVLAASEGCGLQRRLQDEWLSTGARWRGCG
jgi:hypothetical protein